MSSSGRARPPPGPAGRSPRCPIRGADRDPLALEVLERGDALALDRRHLGEVVVETGQGLDLLAVEGVGAPDGVGGGVGQGEGQVALPSAIRYMLSTEAEVTSAVAW